MARLWLLLRADLKLFMRNFFSVLLITIAGVGSGLLAYFLSLQGFFPRTAFLAVCFWFIVLFSVFFTVLPVVFRDYKLGLVVQYSLGGLTSATYLFEKLLLVLLQLVLPLLCYTVLFAFLSGTGPGEWSYLLLVFFLEFLALSELGLLIAALSAEFEERLFFVLILPLLLPGFLAALHLFVPPGLNEGGFPAIWLHWLISYIVTLFFIHWLTAGFLWEEF